MNFEKCSRVFHFFDARFAIWRVPRFCSGLCVAEVVLAALLPRQLPGPMPKAAGTQVADAQLPAEVQSNLDEWQAVLRSGIAARDARTAATVLNQIGGLWLHAGNAKNALVDGVAELTGDWMMLWPTQSRMPSA
jgi:hypothetical protein